MVINLIGKDHGMQHSKAIHLYFPFFFIAFNFLFIDLFSQERFHGMVADSATLQALPNVNIRVKNSNALVVSDAHGNFSVEARQTDTLILSMIGYYTEYYAVKKLRETLIIYMTEQHTLLAPIEIDGKMLIPGLKKLPKQSPWQNPTGLGFTEVPGAPTIQTFGPGYVARGFISKHSAYEKEKVKLREVQEENRKAKGYVEIVNSAEVKDKLMQEYKLSEDDYYRLLATFNERNKDFMYDLQDKELISLLFAFFAEKNKK